MISVLRSVMSASRDSKSGVFKAVALLLTDLWPFSCSVRRGGDFGCERLKVFWRFFLDLFDILLLFGVFDRVRVLTVVRRVRSLNLSVVRRSRDSVCEPLKSKSGVFKAVAPLLTDLGAFWYL